MKNQKSSTSKGLRRYALLFALAIPAGYGCMATTSGSGATTPVTFTSVGTASTLSQPISDVAVNAKTVLADNGIAIEHTATKNGGDHREYKGTANGLDVTVSLDRKGPEVTKVEVSARKNLIEWNKDFAKKINEQIAAKT